MKSASAVPNFEDHLLHLADWGFFHLTIPEAAALTAIDMWYAGEIVGVAELEDFDGDIADPRLKNGLAGHIEQLAQQILKSFSSGLLNADLCFRDLDDNIIPEETYISYDELCEWLKTRRYIMTEAGNEWYIGQVDKVLVMANDVTFYRAATKKQIRDIESTRLTAEWAAITGQEPDCGLEDAYKAAIVEIHRLRQAMAARHDDRPAKGDRPVSTRQRRTLLTIIAALCDYSAIKPNERGAAGQIAGMTDEIKASVSAETIVGLLREIPDALETRIK